MGINVGDIIELELSFGKYHIVQDVVHSDYGDLIKIEGRECPLYVTPHNGIKNVIIPDYAFDMDNMVTYVNVLNRLHHNKRDE